MNDLFSDILLFVLAILLVILGYAAMFKGWGETGPGCPGHDYGYLGYCSQEIDQ